MYRSPAWHICEPVVQRKFCERYVLPLETTGADRTVGSLFVCPGLEEWKGKSQVVEECAPEGEGTLGMSSNSSAIEGFLNGASSPVNVD